MTTALFSDFSSEPFIVKRATQILEQQLKEKGAVRITYVALKQQLIAEFGDTEYGRNKVYVQKILEESVRKNAPQLAAAYAKEQARQAEVIGVCEKVTRSNANQKGGVDTPKAPKLYFYKMNEEECGIAEGNRYIQNGDL
jgi:hypothetical protein